MRPTEIGLPLPQQKTPSPYTVLMTTRGDTLGPNIRSFSRKGSFGRDPRFSQYRELAKRTGFIGPGSYLLANSRAQSSCKVRISAPRQQGNGFYISGNHLVYDPVLNGFLTRPHEKKKEGKEITQDWKRRLRPLGKSESFFLPPGMDVTPKDLPKLTKSRSKRRIKRGKSKSITQLQ